MANVEFMVMACKARRNRRETHFIDGDDCFYYHSWRNNVVIAFIVDEALLNKLRINMSEFALSEHEFAHMVSIQIVPTKPFMNRFICSRIGS